MGVSATIRRRPQGIAAKDQGYNAPLPTSNEEPEPMVASKPPKTNHLVTKRRRTPAPDSKKSLRIEWDLPPCPRPWLLRLSLPCVAGTDIPLI
jgi:hypothetical protein